MISVIIPIYNCEQYLPTCIQSVTDQSYQDFEVILVDDGSTDSSGHLCDEYSQNDSRFQAIHIDNSGPSHARNEGINNCKGELIFFLDSDDFLDKDPVQKGDDANIQFYNAVENLKAGQLNKKNILNLARKYKIDKKEAIRFVKEMWATKLEATNPKLNKEAKRIKLSDLLNENVLGELPSSKLIKMKWNPLNEDMIYDMKKEYYDISDAMDILDSIKKLTPEDLEKLGVDKKMGWQGKEVKIWTQIQKLFRQSDLGRVL